MNEEERLTLNNHLENLYQAMQIGDIKFEPKHSSELYNLINKLLEENKQLKEKLERVEKANKEAVELIKELYDETDDISCYEINKKRKEMLLDILDTDKGDMKDE